MGDWELIASEQQRGLVERSRLAEAAGELSRRDQQALARAAGRRAGEAAVQAFLTHEVEKLVGQIRAESVALYRKYLTLMKLEVTRPYPQELSPDAVLDVHAFTNRFAVGQAVALGQDYEGLNNNFAAAMKGLTTLVFQYPDQRGFIAGLLERFSRG